MVDSLNIVVLGLSITSSWGNGHATTYRSLLRALHARGHEILFLERDTPWYAEHRDLPTASYVRTELYTDLVELKDCFAKKIEEADLCIIGSYVPEGVPVGEWVNGISRGITAFYDIDTPVTISRLLNDCCEYISPELIGTYNLYLSFTGGPVLRFLEKHFGVTAARALYCSVDPEMYQPSNRDLKYDLGYMGTYSRDRQPGLERLLLEPARIQPSLRMAVAGSMYPEDIRWPPNVSHLDHLPPAVHADFYNEQRFTLNLTRRDMIEMGYSPSVRLFEAAACATPIVSDYWEGLDSFFAIGSEILVAHTPAEVVSYLRLSPAERASIGQRARRRVLERHTATHRAVELESYFEEIAGDFRLAGRIVGAL